MTKTGKHRKKVTLPIEDAGKGADLLDRPSSSRPVSIIDRRRVGREETAKATAPSLKPSYVEQLEDRMKRTEEAFKERVNLLEEETQRSRKRIELDLERRFQEREGNLLLEVLDILDDLDRAVAVCSEAPTVREGLELIASRAALFLERHGCERLSPEGEAFDPETMEAVAVQPGPENRVVAVIQPGYRREDVLLRAARVAVGKSG